MNDLIILAGGKGSRIKDKLKNMPKPMAEIGSKHFLDYLLLHVSKFQFENIFIIAGHKGNIIKKRYHKQFYNLALVNVVVEKKLKGTAGCLFDIKKKIKNDFFIINGDTIFNLNLLSLPKLIKNDKICAIALVKNKNYKSNTKLINLHLDKKSNISYSYKNTRLMNGGVYFFKKRFLRYIKEKLLSLEEDILPKLINKKLIKGMVFDSYFLDIGTPENLKFAKKNIPKLFKKPAIFFDRDGVINLDFGYVYQEENISFVQKTLKLIKEYKKKDYYFFIITNQAGIAKGMYTNKQFIEFQRILQFKLSKKGILFDDIHYCPHHPNGKISQYNKICLCRKPGNKMILDIFKRWPIIKEKSFFIGDKISDYKAAKLSKLKYFNVDSI